MLLVNLFRPPPKAMRVEVAPDAAALGPLAAAYAGSGANQACLLAHVPALVWGTTVEAEFTSDARCRRKSKCLVDPYAMR